MTATNSQTVGAPPKSPKRRLGGAALVAIGILASRIFGIVREMLRGKYLGATVSYVADAWVVAIRIPNMLQNLLGEGVLSASFIPVYTGLLAQKDEEDAGIVAGAVLATLSLAVAVIVAAGVIFAPWIVRVLATGLKGPAYELAVQLTRILFPGAALFVLAAWCIGILNSHHRFFLAYIAPVFWNLTMIAAFVWYGPRVNLPSLARAVAWASVVGAGIQFLVQLPAVLRLVPKLKVRFSHRHQSVRTVLINILPVMMSRGVVQISASVDLWIAVFLPQGSAALLATAQAVNMLPVSLFGMAVSAAELPAMSSITGTVEERAALLRERLQKSLRQVTFLVIPSAVAFLLFGDVIIRVLYQRGRFTELDTLFAWGVLAGSAVGLLAGTLGRLYSAAYYSMKDTKQPLRYAIIRVALTMALGWIAAVPLPRYLGIDGHWGTAGLTLTAGIAGWVEFALLRRELQKRIGPATVSRDLVIRLWGVAAVAGALGYGVQLLLGSARSIVVAIAVLGTYGMLYLVVTDLIGIPEARAFTRRLLRRRA
ncbi:MAG: murein biosynthesis integral membrane protein MurJ [Gemmatimonadaceae bacterium]|nr:murein biosynthesis integral membrane protein MurJ [Gemmatimonadaceae bacterium]